MSNEIYLRGESDCFICLSPTCRDPKGFFPLSPTLHFRFKNAAYLHSRPEGYSRTDITHSHSLQQPLLVTPHFPFPTTNYRISQFLSSLTSHSFVPVLSLVAFLNSVSTAAGHLARFQSHL